MALLFEVADELMDIEGVDLHDLCRIPKQCPVSAIPMVVAYGGRQGYLQWVVYAEGRLAGRLERTASNRDFPTYTPFHRPYPRVAKYDPTRHHLKLDGADEDIPF